MLMAGLAGCVAPQPQNVPLVALPGPAKMEAEFRQDDTTCRAASVTLPAEPAARTAQPTPGTAQPAPGAAQAAPEQGFSPGMLYLRCMAARGNTVEPLAPVRPVLYGYYAPYPVWVGYGGLYYPWLYGNYIGVGFYGGGFYGGGWGGYRGYGHGYYGGGFRSEGFHGGGFHGGGGRR